VFADSGGVSFSKGNIRVGSVVPLIWSWQDFLGNNVLIDSTDQQVAVTNCATSIVVFFADPGSSGLQLLADLSWQINWQTVDNITGEDLPAADYCARIDYLSGGMVIQSQFSGPITVRESR
jgi:hypothetical protein